MTNREILNSADIQTPDSDGLWYLVWLDVLNYANYQPEQADATPSGAGLGPVRGFARARDCVANALAFSFLHTDPLDVQTEPPSSLPLGKNITIILEQIPDYIKSDIAQQLDASRDGLASIFEVEPRRARFSPRDMHDVILRYATSLPATDARLRSITSKLHLVAVSTTPSLSWSTVDSQNLIIDHHGSSMAIGKQPSESLNRSLATATHVMIYTMYYCLENQLPFPELSSERTYREVLQQFDPDISEAISKLHSQFGHDIDQRLALNVYFAVRNATAGISPADTTNENYDKAMVSAATELARLANVYSRPVILADHMIDIGPDRLGQLAAPYTALVDNMIESGNLELANAEYDGTQFVIITFRESSLEKQGGKYTDSTGGRIEQLPVRLKKFLNRSHFGWPEFLLACVAKLNQGVFPDPDCWIAPMVLEYRLDNSFHSATLGVIGHLQSVERNSREAQMLLQAQRLLAGMRIDLVQEYSHIVEPQQPRNLYAVVARLQGLTESQKAAEDLDRHSVLKPNPELQECVDSLLRLIAPPILNWFNETEPTDGRFRHETSQKKHHHRFINPQFTGDKTGETTNVGGIEAYIILQVQRAIIATFLSLSPNFYRLSARKQLRGITQRLVGHLERFLFGDISHDRRKLLTNVLFTSERTVQLNVIFAETLSSAILRAINSQYYDQQSVAQRQFFTDTLNKWQNAYSGDTRMNLKSSADTTLECDTQVAELRLQTAIAQTYRDQLSAVNKVFPRYANTPGDETLLSLLSAIEDNRAKLRKTLSAKKEEIDERVKRITEKLHKKKQFPEWLDEDTLRIAVASDSELDENNAVELSAFILAKELLISFTQFDSRITRSMITIALIHNQSWTLNFLRDPANTQEIFKDLYRHKRLEERKSRKY